MQTGPSARAVALAALGLVRGRATHSDSALHQQAGYAALAPRDRAFALNLLQSTLRWHRLLDGVLEPHLQRGRTPDVVRDILWLGACQLLVLQTPPHAAISTSVDLARAVHNRFAGLVNAVLRKVAPAVLPQPTLAALPTWLRTGLSGLPDPGPLVAALLSPAPLDLSVRDPASAAHWATMVGATMLPTGSLRLAGGVIEDLPGYGDGAWWVQDAAAALPVRLLGDIAGQDVIDLCAAPGGKTAQLAAAGARVTAVEQDTERLERLRDNLARLRLPATLVAADAIRWRPPEPAAAVLLDAPCSATGTIRRHPDMMIRRKGPELPRLIATQRALLAAAAGMVRPGGTLVYAVCSLLPAEGRDVARAAPPSLRPEPITQAELTGLPARAFADGWVQTRPDDWPEQGGMDGFFIARFRRV